MLNIERLLSDYRIPLAQPGSKHHRPGWVNVPCPFCQGHSGHHLGFRLDRQVWYCHRCGGGKGKLRTIAALLHLSLDEARAVLRKYGDSRPTPQELTDAASRPRSVVLPHECAPLGKRHRAYLEQRRFDPDHLAVRWGLLGTNHLGPYKHRIIAPITRDGQLISFQGRDITGRSPLKYKACSLDQEVHPHKHWLYGMDQLPTPRHSVLVVEGITDVWRLGPGAVATFGIEWTRQQALLLRHVPRRFVLFDSNEPAAKAQAEALAGYLSAFPGHTETLELEEGDPADLTDADARALMHQLSF